MGRQRFPIDSDQLELLLAMESTASLQDLSKAMCRDSSVVSRHLTRLGSEERILTKNQRRWHLTETGKELNNLTRKYLQDVAKLLDMKSLSPPAVSLPKQSALLIVNAQTAFDSVTLGASSNARSSANIRSLLLKWRQAGMPIIHAPHVSSNQSSPLRAGGPGAAFMPGIEPHGGEWVVEKSEPSAFTGTSLTSLLDEHNIGQIVVVGFSAQECIDFTVKHAVATGYKVLVVDDALAQFEVKSPNGRSFAAADVHEIVVTGLSQIATVAETEQVLDAVSLIQNTNPHATRSAD